jgi:sugar lactone lactonase YvrE
MSASDTQLLADGFVFLEGPRWHDGSLWVSDQHGHKVFRVEMDGTKTTVAEFEDMPSGLGFLPDGSLLVSLMRTRMVMRVLDGTTSVHSDLTDVSRGFLNTRLHLGWINDMVTDGKGRTYVGHRRGRYAFLGDFPPEGWIVLVEPDGHHYVVAEGVHNPNGAIVTPDGNTLIVAETRARRLSAWTIEEDGSLSDRRAFAALKNRPDGICLDAEGAVWVGDPDGASFTRVRKGGEVVDSVQIENGHTVACVLGGPDRRTLFMIISNTHGTVMSEQLTAADDANSKCESRIETIEVEVPGAGWP